jgi:uncharacterized protein
MPVVVRWKRSAVGAALAAVGTVVAASCSLARPAMTNVGVAPVALGASTATFPSGSGSTIHAWYSAGRPGEGAVLLLHGVGADRRVMLERARFLHAAGYAVLIPDFQAHGESPGTHITFGALESLDAAAALAFLRLRSPGERVGVIGVSMGGAAALVGPGGPLTADALVLESVYPTIRDATHDRLRSWFGPFGPPFTTPLIAVLRRQIGVSPDSLRPIERIARLHAPVLVAAGTVDRYTTIAEAHALFDRAVGPKDFWAVDGAGHVDLHEFAPAEYERRVGTFLGHWLRGDRADVALMEPPATR